MGDPSVGCVLMYSTGLVTVQPHSLPPPPPPPSPSTSLAATRRSQVVVVTQQNLEAKKKTALPSFIRPFLCLAISFLWPCGVDFNLESVRGR